ncbi:MAG TPA: C69 family dipeptidase, partial [Candidatus Binataceae bacterium]|nr:C69 family dipeptidase [Candidatus Binataceae bacterium]
YLEIPQVPETAAVIGSRPFWLFGFEHGINEHGVAIGNEAVLTREELPATGLLGMDLVRLGLERGRSAREATEIIGALIERYGQGGSAAYDFDFRYSSSFIIAAHGEAYVLESSGRQWCARKVDGRACISNRLTTSGYDFGSRDVESYARERGWIASGASFDFSRAYARADIDDPLFARERIARSSELVGRGGKRTRREMFAMLRDHYERGEMPIIAAPAGSPRSFSICMHSVSATTASMVAELPAPGSGGVPLIWCSFAAPCTSIFIPLFPGAAIPPILAAGAANPSADSPWWRMRKIQQIVESDPERLAPIVWKHFRPLENAMLERAGEVVHRAAALAGAARAAILGNFMAQNVVRVMREVAIVEAALTRAAT